MPLPFKRLEHSLPDNKQAVFCRTANTLSRLKRDSNKLAQCIDSMQKSIDAGHVEPSPTTEKKSFDHKRLWYIPVFPVCHPKKGKVRLVYDSSALYQGTSLNQELFQGPDINNGLRTVLVRFRNGKIGFSADIEAMFYAFALPERDKDFT